MKNIEKDTYSLALNIRLSSGLEAYSLNHKYVSKVVTNIKEPVEVATYNNIWRPMRISHKNNSNSNIDNIVNNSNNNIQLK
jgi:hypothetical protein